MEELRLYRARVSKQVGEAVGDLVGGLASQTSHCEVVLVLSPEAVGTGKLGCYYCHYHWWCFVNFLHWGGMWGLPLPKAPWAGAMARR